MPQKKRSTAKSNSSSCRYTQSRAQHDKNTLSRMTDIGWADMPWMNKRSLRQAPTTYRNTSNPIKRFNYQKMVLFGQDPMYDNLLLKKCRKCGRVLLVDSYFNHIANRARGTVKGKINRDFSAQDLEDFGTKSRKDSRNKKAKNSIKGKSHPSDIDSDEYSGDRKLFDRHSGYINLDIQCGVQLNSNNSLCTRPLTCKIHSMYSKSLVKGRSKLFSTLLRDYKRQEQGKSSSRPLDAQFGTEKYHVKVKEHIYDDFSDSKIDKAIDILMDSKNSSKFNLRPPPRSS